MSTDPSMFVASPDGPLRLYRPADRVRDEPIPGTTRRQRRERWVGWEPSRPEGYDVVATAGQRPTRLVDPCRPVRRLLRHVDRAREQHPRARGSHEGAVAGDA